MTLKHLHLWLQRWIGTHYPKKEETNEKIRKISFRLAQKINSIKETFDEGSPHYRDLEKLLDDLYIYVEEVEVESYAK